MMLALRIMGRFGLKRSGVISIVRGATITSVGPVLAEVFVMIALVVSLSAGLAWQREGAAVGTGWIVTSFSPPIQDAFKRFLLPAVFGAVFGQFVLRGPKYAPVALILALVPLYLKWPAYVTIPLAVFGTMLFGRLSTV